MKLLGDRASAIPGSLSQLSPCVPANGACEVAAGNPVNVPDRAAGQEDRHSGKLSSHRVPSVGRIVLLLLTAGVWIWIVSGAHDARVAQNHWDKVLAAAHQLESNQWYGPPEASDSLFEHAAAAVAAEPADIHYRYWLGVYKWLSLTPYMDPNTGQLQPAARPWARRVVEELHRARPLCPTFGPLYCVVGEIETFAMGDPGGTSQIRNGFRLAPCNPDVCFITGRMDAEEGKTDDAFEKLTRAVQLDGSYFPKAASLLVSNLDRGDLALRLAGDDAGRLAYVGALLAAGKTQEQPTSAGDVSPGSSDRGQLAVQARAQAFEQLKVKCEQPDAPASAHATLANLYSQKGEIEMAIRHYRWAVQAQYDQVGWHYALAQLLVQVDQVEEAAHEARICLRLRPDHTPARKMLERLSIRPLTTQRASTTGR
jgi:tetratricopeptide (TPR) repeat protein